MSDSLKQAICETIDGTIEPTTIDAMGDDDLVRFWNCVSMLTDPTLRTFDDSTPDRPVSVNALKRVHKVACTGGAESRLVKLLLASGESQDVSSRENYEASCLEILRLIGRPVA